MSVAFACRLSEFNATTDAEKLGTLIAAATLFATHRTKQTVAWQAEIQFLAGFVSQCLRCKPGAGKWYLAFEFEIPRRGKRPDVVLLADDLIFVLEFKIGADTHRHADAWQALSYALDLRDFHLGSRGRQIIPVLVATDALPPPLSDQILSGMVVPVRYSGGRTGDATAQLIMALYAQYHRAENVPISPADWVRSPYRPTPTIIEAAQQLFAGHTVKDISHSFATNLTATCDYLLKVISKAKEKRERAICFVTGTPGAGKTLAGLNVVHDSSFRSSRTPSAVFLSGNGPLVKIIRAALVRDQQRVGIGAKEAKRTVATFIDNVHRFIATYALQDLESPAYENAIVFDEAQRAWDSAAVARLHGVDKSEPEMVLDIMERAPDWCAVIALVGGGQEINKGEAGLNEWGKALNGRSVSWQVYASPSALSGDDSVAGQRLFDETPSPALHLTSEAALHLEVSVRSPRAKFLSEWVNQLLSSPCNRHSSANQPEAQFPIAFSRNLENVKAWLREKSEGTQTFGLMASSGALRLRAHGIELSTGFRHGYPFEEWFLADRNDSRSSSWLEVAATEFECQGLELDWTGVCWGGDFVLSPKTQAWLARKFRGAKWQSIRRPAEARYVVNKYRVLLTRARRGMVIWIPPGDQADPSREPELLDATAALFTSEGIPCID